ncbi:hypothetical protein HPP92_027371 [Vanilla planifolia]|uniref:Uncharacterized protein n=1 Tax=Vanilla planifolia TaxID=51239 RepID=A0A835P9Z8_VANPL|nr:hypothetical protein HPP92_027371 [Vanilla planifolia]
MTNLGALARDELRMKQVACIQRWHQRLRNLHHQQVCESAQNGKLPTRLVQGPPSPQGFLVDHALRYTLPEPGKQQQTFDDV